MFSAAPVAMCAQPHHGSPDADVWTGIVRVVRHRDSGIEIQVLNDQTLKPVARVYPLSLGALPHSACMLPNAVVQAKGRIVTSTALVDGLIIKVFGYKPPSSTVIDVFRAEVLIAANTHS